MSSSNNDEERRDIVELQENFTKQQAKISALKELVRKSEEAYDKSNSSTKEKVKNIAQRLTHLKTKARSRKNLEMASSEVGDDPIFEDIVQVIEPSSPLSALTKIRPDTPGSEKVQLLRQKMEENKLKIAERENNKKEIEEMVKHLQARIDTTQQSLERSSELGRSMGDLTSLSSSNVTTKFKSAADLSFTPLNLEKEKIKFLENRVKMLEKQLEKSKNIPRSESDVVASLESKILDLKENLKEKECVIQARTQAVSLMSENLSAKGKSTVDLLEDTKQEMLKLQMNFVQTEEELKVQIENLQSVVHKKDEKILSLEEANNILETARFELTIKNSELEGKMKDVQYYSTKISELNKLNESLQNRITTLESERLETNDADDEKLKKQIEEEYANTVIMLHERINEIEKENNELKKRIHDTEVTQNEVLSEDTSLAEKIRSLENTIASQQREIDDRVSRLQTLENELAEKTVQCNVLSANFAVLEEKLKISAPRSLFSTSTCEETEMEIRKLKGQLDEANKSMIKMKLKCKQLQKEVDVFTKVSDTHAELMKVTEENGHLQQKIWQLEEEKGQLQLKLISGELTQTGDSDLEKKFQILETTCQNQTAAIQLLEEQKLDITDNLELAKQQLDLLRSQVRDQEQPDRAVSQIELATQIENDQVAMKEFENSMELQKENVRLLEDIDKLQHEKNELEKKVQHYITENMDLVDKIEKLSKSSSSAESIEIVERLTHQEKLEIEEFNKRFEEEHRDYVEGYTQTVISQAMDQVDHLSSEKLAEELSEVRKKNAELEHKIELFSIERREVLEKIEILTHENLKHINTIDEIAAAKMKVDADFCALKTEFANILSEQTTKIDQEEGNVSTGNLQEFLKVDAIEKCIHRLSSEVENYAKATDKSVKVHSSKKLAKEARNVCQQVEELLKEINRYSKESRIVMEELESVRRDYELANKRNDDLEEALQKLATLQSSEISTIRNELEFRNTAANNEIEILKNLVEEQKQKIIESYTEREVEMNTKLEEVETLSRKIDELQQELLAAKSSKEEYYEKYLNELKTENANMEHLLNEEKSSIATKMRELNNKQETIDVLNSQIVDLYKNLENTSNELAEKNEEITFLQDLLDNGRRQMEQMQQENDENKKIIEKLHMEQHLQPEKNVQVDTLLNTKEKNQQLEAYVQDLEKKLSDSESKCNKQHDKLMKFAANLKKKIAQCTELEQKLKEFSVKHQKMEDKSVETVSADLFDHDLIMLKNKLNAAEEQGRLLEERSQIQLKDKQIELDNMKHQLDDYQFINSRAIAQISKLQLLADNLHFDFEERDQKVLQMQQKIEIMRKEHQDELKSMSNNFNVKSLKFEKSKAIIKEKNKEIQKLTYERDELQRSIENYKCKRDNADDLLSENAKLKEEYAILLERSEKEKTHSQETIVKLQTLYDGVQAKLQEDMAYIESLELDNNKFREKISKLEECVAVFEERRASLERQANVLGHQLQKNKDEYEKNEDALVYRVNMLSQHDDVIGRRLLESQEELEELTEKLEHSKIEYTDLMDKFIKLEKSFDSHLKEKYQVLETENQSLKEQITLLQTEMGRMQSEYESKLLNKTTEIDEWENDLSVQLQALNAEKRSLQESVERAQDEIQAFKDENMRLKENENSLEQIKNDLEREITWIRMQNENLSQDQFELQELRMQVLHDKTEIENQNIQLEALVQNHEIEINTLRMQIRELDSMRMQVGQNQTDDQVFIETENRRLKDLLTEKEALIDNYQRQNLKLQMKSLSGSTDPFAVIPQEPSIVKSLEGNIKKSMNYEEEIATLRKFARENEERNYQLSKELAETHQELQQLSTEKQREISDLIAELERLKHLQIEGTAVQSLGNTSLSANSFSDTMIARESQSQSDEDRQNIEVLKRKVLDLEKYAAELENTVKHLTHIQGDKNTAAHQAPLVRRSEVLEEGRKDTEKKTDTETPSLTMFFDNSPPENREANTFFSKLPPISPAVEEVIIPKKMYICGTTQEDNNIAKQDLNEHLGWESEDVVAVEGFSTLAEKNLEMRLKEYEDRFRELELEKQRLEESKVELQVKSGKMMKKLKDYKAKLSESQRESTTVSKGSSIESSDLDLAIQEELKTQINNLEEIIAELKKQQTNDAAEKKRLLKQIDGLNAANKRVMEMKEQQNAELAQCKMQVRNLQQNLRTLEEWSDTTNETNLVGSSQANRTVSGGEDDQNWQQRYLEMSSELEDVKVDRDELQALLDEEREIRRDTEEKLLALTTKVKSLEEDNLTKTHITSMQAEFKMLTDTYSECKLKNEKLELQLAEYKSTIDHLSNKSNIINANLNALQNEYKQKLSDNDKLTDELRSWVEKCDNLKAELEMLKIHTNNYPIETANNHEQGDLHTDQVEETLKKTETERGFGEQMQSLEVTKCELEERVKHLEKTLNDVQLEKSHLENELEVLNNHILKSFEEEDKIKQTVFELDTKNIEIMELKKSVEILKGKLKMYEDQTVENSDQRRTDLDRIVEQRCLEVAESWERYVTELQTKFNQTEELLRKEIQELRSMDSKDVDRTKADTDEVFVDVQEMQAALEAQEMEIVTLKEQLAQRSAEYARLAAQHDPYAQNTTNLNSPVRSTQFDIAQNNQSALDLAHYMLHQRDMRCEELALELSNLLEERDTLQLKLSNSLRRIEEIKSRTDCFESGSESDLGASSNVNSPKKSTFVSSSKVQRNVFKDLKEDLNTKLSQLHSPSQSYDKPIQEKGQPQRDIENIQQDVANMPAEAISEIVGQDFSGTSQSASAVLMNWLLGKNSSNSQNS